MRKGKTDSTHRWRFFRAGGFDQVRLDTGADLADLDSLDQKLWVALACPAKGIEFDAKTLDLIDTDKDGRIRAPEILAATRWACRCLRDPGDLLKMSPSIPLAAINGDSAEGKPILASARQILVNLGKADATEISLEDTADTERIFAQTQFNGDGVIPADSAKSAALREVIEQIIATLGGVPDRSGKPGVDQERVDRFFAEAQAFADWWAKAEADRESVLPLGDATSSAHAALTAIRPKIEDYFARCRLAAFDTRALAALNRQESEYLALAAKDLTITSEEVAAFPLSKVEPDRPLPLTGGINPAWDAAVGRLRDEVVAPLLGDKTELTSTEWSDLQARFGAYEGWMAIKAGAVVESLGLPRVRQILQGGAKGAIDDLLAKDKALEPEANAIAEVDRLIHYHRDLCRLLNNFVSFRDFYGRRDKAVFQAGTLYLDQRSCDLCVRVADMGRHATLAGLAKTCLVYCDCTHPSTGRKMTIAAAFTGGDSDYLIVGRNGVFYDRNGQDWDATITKIIDNPISIRQAFWSPYKRFVRMIEEQVAKRAAAAEAASTARMDQAATSVATADKATKPPEPKKLDVGVVAAMGVAVGAIGTAVAALVTGILGLAAWQIPLVFVGILLIISGPSMVIAWLKLRQRNLGPILDASGWAVNARAKINIPFGASLTGVASLPPGSVRDLSDPYAEKRTFRKWFIRIFLLLIVLAAGAGALWHFGIVEKQFPGVFPKPGWMQEQEKKAEEEKTKEAASPPADEPK